MSKNNHDISGDMKGSEESKENYTFKNIDDMSCQKLGTQCGGHKEGFVDIGQGFILKELQNPPRGPRELEFYEKVFDPACEDQDLLDLRQFLPPYHGVEIINNVQFLKLKNLTCQFRYPCVADIKMGRVTYDQEALPAKQLSETSKWPPRTKLGYGLTGMIVYNPDTQQKQSYDKKFGIELTENDILTKGFGTFYGLENGHICSKVIESHIQRLQELESWFSRQRKFSFVASSLLFVYEGEAISNIRSPIVNPNLALSREDSIETQKQCNSTQHAGDSTQYKDSKWSNLSYSEKADLKQAGDNDGESCVKKMKQCNNTKEEFSVSNLPLFHKSSKAEVWLIDFAHVFPSLEEDENFLFGLKNLIKALEEFLLLSK